MERTAILRGVPRTLPRCLSRGGTAAKVDLPLAVRQHAAYAAALEDAGFRVHVLPADDRYPDSVFVEDTAVVLGSTVVLTNPGAPSRRGEVEAVAAFLDGRVRLDHLRAPATLDGGDVLRVGRTIFVGRSSRTNEVGIEQLRRIAGRHGLDVRSVAVDDTLHLKSAVTALDEASIVVAKGLVDLEPFSRLRILTIPQEEGRAANVVRLKGSKVLLPAGAPQTTELLTAAGFEPIGIDISEFEKADGGLTCLSLLFG